MNLYQLLEIGAVAFTPLIERGALPVALLHFGWIPVLALLWVLAFNLLSVLAGFWLFPRLVYLAALIHPRLRKLVEDFYSSKFRRHSKFFNLWGALALVIATALPIPGAGPWTGTLLAWLFNIDRKTAYPALILGCAIAGLLLTMITLGGSKLVTL
jgi:uncharacterized membrane protein